MSIICKCCGAGARWCDSKPDEDGDKHKCNHIQCDACGMNYQLIGPWPKSITSFKKAKAMMLSIYNGTGADQPQEETP